MRKLLIFIAAAALIVSCQAGPVAGEGARPPEARQPVDAGAPASAQPSATFTPFQAVLATPRPTFTFTPTASPTPTLVPCQGQPGRIEVKEEVFPTSGRPFHFRVYLPPCFDYDTNARYPVLYMIHGQTYSDDQWERLGIGAAADALINEGQSAPFLIVMPREPDTFSDIYLTTFNKDVTDGLVSWMDEHYPTCAERACRAIGGLSRGGAWALHLGFTRWELFGAVGLHSTPPFNTDPGRFPAWLRAIPPDQVPRIYMDSGRRDAWLGMSSAFEAQLVNLSVPHEWYLFNGEHNEEYWSAHVRDYLEWYTAPWQ